MYSPIYPNYYPTNYNQPNYSNPVPQQNIQTQQSNSITWVQGEASAKAFPVGAGQSVLLMDSEESVFYIKSTDQSGMPQPLRIYDYKERNSQPRELPVDNADEYVSRKEFDEFREDVKRSIKGIRRPIIEEEGEG
jgi:hypothetical protein